MNVQQSTLPTEPDNDPGCTCHGIEWSFACFEHCNRPKPEDREPPEPDGEAYRGGEAASALAEEQGRIQRTLK